MCIFATKNNMCLTYQLSFIIWCVHICNKQHTNAWHSHVNERTMFFWRWCCLNIIKTKTKSIRHYVKLHSISHGLQVCVYKVTQTHTCVCICVHTQPLINTWACTHVWQHMTYGLACQLSQPATYDAAPVQASLLNTIIAHASVMQSPHMYTCIFNELNNMQTKQIV